MLLVALSFMLSLLPRTAFAIAPQLSCTSTDKGTQQQLAITPNALGSHDVSLRTLGHGPPQLTWLALRLTCTVHASNKELVSNAKLHAPRLRHKEKSHPHRTEPQRTESRVDKVWQCNASQHNPLSPHARSTLRSAWHKEQPHSQGELAITITSPLLSPGTATFRFASEHCTTATRAPRRTYTQATHSCQAYFRGAYYDPDQGDCVAGTLSGCRNPFPHRSRSECRAALKLAALPSE